MDDKINIKLTKKQIETKLLLYRQLLIRVKKQCEAMIDEVEAKILEIEES